MKKAVLFLPLLAVCFFVFSSNARAYSTCYTTSGATELLIGDMHIWGKLPYNGGTRVMSFIFANGNAVAEFADKESDVVAGSIYFKAGNAAWEAPTSSSSIWDFNKLRFYTSYFYNFSSTVSDVCSNFLVNVRWNSARDAGRTHYCCDATTNYKEPVGKNPDLLPNYTWSYTDALFANGKAALHDYYENYIEFEDSRLRDDDMIYNIGICSEYSLYLNGQVAARFNFSYPDKCSSIPNPIFSTQDLSSNGKMTVSLSPITDIIPGTFSQGSGSPGISFLNGLMFRPNPIGTWCGGCLYSGWIPPDDPPTLSECPGQIAQEGGTCKYTLINEYEPVGASDYVSYVEFTADVPDEYPYVGASTLEVNAGKWGGGVDYRIVCKVRDMTTGEETGEVSSAVFPLARRCSDANFGTLPSDWVTLNFSSNPVELIDERTYRLYCRSNFSWAPLCWMYGCGDPEYGKDYRINVDICPNAECSQAFLSPDSFSLAPEESIGLIVSGLSGSALLDVHVDHVVFRTSDNGVASISTPVSDITYPFQSTVVGEAEGSATIDARIFLKPDDNVEDCSGTASVTVDEIQSAWFQTMQGDVHAGGDIRSEVILGDYFNLLGFVGGTPGLVSFSGTNSNFGEGQVSATEWLANASLSSRRWSYFYPLLGSPSVDNFNDLTDITTDGTYFSEDDVSISGDIAGSRAAIVFVDGNVTITGNIQVPVGSFLAIISSGNLIVEDAVSTIEGMFIAENFDSGSGDVALLGQGMFIFGSVSLGRDLGAGNGSAPAEDFEFRPDFFLNAPSSLMKGSYSWQEMAP
ncbi:MAG: hypothetical protein ABIH88_00295 [Patescibacteria group bacterium]